MHFVNFCKLVAAVGLCLAMAGCYACSTKQDPDKLRQKTAETTANLKQDAKAVAAGIREGIQRDDRIDLNSATAKELGGLPGITAQKAQKIVANRPYGSAKELVTKHVVTAAEYDKIAGKVTVKK